MGLEHCRVVLVQTHYPGNLGATARVMLNLGLRELVLVAPLADRADLQARQMSTHGETILQNARVVSGLDEAIADCVLVVGTSARSGGLFRLQTVGTPEAILPAVADVLRQDRPAAIVFGPEPTGLTNEFVTRCQYLIQIPTAPEYPALNLAQAVAICLYELRKAWLGPSNAPTAEERATVESQEQMFRQLQAALEEIHFLYGDKADSLMNAVRHLLGKAGLTEMEIGILHGLARQIRWYAKHHPKLQGPT
jgi:tRNA/rRNA methyltransferase